MPGMGHVGHGRNRADAEQSHDDTCRQKVEPHHRKPEGKAGDGEAGQNEADKIEGVGPLDVHIGDIAAGQGDADEADRHVDQKNPVP